MNHTIKGIIIVAAIASMLVLGMNMFPLAQNTYASSHRHQDNIANQQDDTYRSPGSESSNVVVQESGKGNSATSFSDQSSNLQQQQNQPTSSQQKDPQANKDKDKSLPITLNVLPNQRIINTNVNPNRNTAGSNSGSASDASNNNTIDNTALARQRQAEASCAVALTCPEGSTAVTVTPTLPTSTCVPPTVGGQTATPTDGTCTALLPAGATDREVDLFERECMEAGGEFTGTPETGLTCTFPSTPPT